MKKITCLIVLVLLLANNASAQKRIAILVMLTAQKNKVEHFKKKGDKVKLNAVNKDVESLMQVTINDFKDHFSYCPVYYFMDSNLHLVKEKKFAGILFDEQRRIYESPPLTIADTASYWIVYQGQPPVQIKPKEDPDGLDVYREPAYPSAGVIFLNHNFEKIPKSRFFYSRIGKGRKVTQTRPKYNYMSYDFDLSYFEMAKWINSKMKGVNELLFFSTKDPY